jgi:hypothetical protein
MEKKTLERQADFSTVAAFTVVDQSRLGYLDFESLRKFLAKFKKDVKKSDVNAIIRRMDLDGDGKITFREFAHGITPEYPGVAQAVTSATAKMPGTQRTTSNEIEFNAERKQEIKRSHEETKQNTIKKRNGSLSPLRDYRPIYNAPTHYIQGSIINMSPVKAEFQ